MTEKNKSEREFKMLDEFKEAYLPEQYKREQLDKLWQAALDHKQEQEPVAYAAFSVTGNIRIYTSSKDKVKSLSEQIGDQLIPLYLHPQSALKVPEFDCFYCHGKVKHTRNEPCTYAGYTTSPTEKGVEK